MKTDDKDKYYISRKYNNEHFISQYFFTFLALPNIKFSSWHGMWRYCYISQRTLRNTRHSLQDHSAEESLICRE